MKGLQLAKFRQIELITKKKLNSNIQRLDFSKQSIYLVNQRKNFETSCIK